MYFNNKNVFENFCKDEFQKFFHSGYELLDEKAKICFDSYVDGIIDKMLSNGFQSDLFSDKHYGILFEEYHRYFSAEMNVHLNKFKYANENHNEDSELYKELSELMKTFENFFLYKIRNDLKEQISPQKLSEIQQSKILPEEKFLTRTDSKESEKIGMSADSTSSSHPVEQNSLNISSVKQENQDKISSWKFVASGVGGGAVIGAGLVILGIAYLGFSIATLGIGAAIGAVVGGAMLGSMALISKYSLGPPLEKSKESENDVHKLGAEEYAKKHGYERVPFWENWSGWRKSSSDKSPNPSLGV